MARSVQVSGAPPKPKKPKTLPLSDPQAVREALAREFEKFPALEVLTRRFNDPSDPGSLPILLRDEPAHACTNSDHQNALKPGSVKCNYVDPETHRVVCTKPVRRWHVRWFNLAQEGRNAQMRAKGYIAVEVAELLNPDDVSDRYGDKTELHVRRGDRGQEILGKQPLIAFNEIKRLQREKRDREARSAKTLRKELAEAAGKELGSEAGDFIHDGGIQVESMTRHRTTLQEEAEATD